jgi:hypothetical protein
MRCARWAPTRPAAASLRAMRRLRAALRLLALATVLVTVTVSPAVAQDTPTATTGTPSAPDPVTVPGTTVPSAAATTPVAPATTPDTTTPSTVAVTAASDDDGPAPLLVGLIVLIVLSLIALALWGLARAFAWEPTWLPRLRHAVGEAGYRTEAGWADFRDWMRPGRR